MKATARPPLGQGSTLVDELAYAKGAREQPREAGLLDSPLGSNAWAFGKQTTANGSGMLPGNPHYPWVGPSRFYQMRLTIAGQLDVMGAALS